MDELKENLSYREILYRVKSVQLGNKRVLVDSSVISNAVNFVAK